MSLAAVALFASLTCSGLAQQLAVPPQVTIQASVDLFGEQTTADPAPWVWHGKRDVDGGANGVTKLDDAQSTTMTIPVAQSTPTLEALPQASQEAPPQQAPPQQAPPQQAPESSPSPLPSPFDESPPSDFKGVNSDDKCPKSISELLNNPTFKSCYPVSMMIQTSRGFFEAEKQLTSIVRVLDTACRANVDSCSDFMEKAAQNLVADANCKAEVDQGHSRVLQAWRGLKAYKVLYTATCLQDPRTNAYCFANAVTNLTNSSDSFLYFLPFGLALPGASAPTCSWCTKQTMQMFQTASVNRQHFVSSKYEDAARQINVACGQDFVNSTLPKAETGAANTTAMPRLVVLLANALIVALVGSILTL